MLLNCEQNKYILYGILLQELLVYSMHLYELTLKE
jgi:hypothetical protein